MDKHLENGIFDKYFWAKLLGTEQVGSERDQIYCKKIVGRYAYGLTIGKRTWHKLRYKK